MCVDGAHVFGGDARIVFVKLEFIYARFRLSFDDYDGDINVPRAWQNNECVQHEQRGYGSQKPGAQMKLLSSSVHVRGKSNGE